MNRTRRVIVYGLAACVAASYVAGSLLVATGRVMGWCLLASLVLLIRLGIAESKRARRHVSLPREKEGVWRAAPTARADDSTAGRLLRRKWGLDHALAVRAARKTPRSGKGKPPALRGEATLDYLLRCKRGSEAGEPALWDRQIDG